MSALMIVLLIISLSLVIMACISYTAILWIRRLRRTAAESLRGDIGEEKVYRVDDCNFFGIASRGIGQVRGNGLLALTHAGLHFRMLLPRRSLFISLTSVQGISYPRWFLKKSKAKEILRVDFINESGAKDACAWLVRSPHWWGEAITALKQGDEPSQP